MSFHGLFTLSELNLGVNNITGLATKAFNGLPRLLSLQLNSNNLRMLTAGAFSKLRNLYRLVLYFNKIAYVDEKAFVGMKRLRHIVWYPPLRLVRSSKILRTLQSNNLHCDCNVKHLKRYLKQQRISSTIFCTRPLYLHRTNITKVRDKYLKCESVALQIQPKYAIVEKYSDAYIKCVTNIAASFTWIRNGKMLQSSYKSFQMTSGILLLRNILDSDSGQYTCIAKSAAGISAISTVVKIGSRPKIAAGDDIVFIRGDDETLVLNCSTTGFPEPLIYWYKNKDMIKKSNERYIVSFNQSLVILRAKPQDAGRYRCKAQNALGVVTKTMTVMFKHTRSQCQPACAVGESCIRRYECMIGNRSVQRCTNYANPTTKTSVTTSHIEPPTTESTYNESIPDPGSSGDGSGDDNEISDDDGEDDGEDSMNDTNRVDIATEKPVNQKADTSRSIDKEQVDTTHVPRFEQIKPLLTPTF